MDPCGQGPGGAGVRLIIRLTLPGERHSINTQHTTPLISKAHDRLRRLRISHQGLTRGQFQDEHIHRAPIFSTRA